MGATTKTAKEQDFVPLSYTLKDIKDNIPAHLFERKTSLALWYLLRDLIIAGTFFALGLQIDTTLKLKLVESGLPPYALDIATWACWLTYWWFQGLAFTGLWVIGHECGHGAFSANRRLCDFIGFITHTALLTPYFSWRFVHHRHHSNHASVENDEVYVPHTRTELRLPADAEGHDLEEHFGDTPLYTIFSLLRQQVIAFPAYLIFNVSGQKRYPRWSNHFNPNAIMFTKGQGNAVIMSNLGLIGMGVLLYTFCSRFGTGPVMKLYGVPWLLVTHWFIMITYLHHTDPELPHYRKGQWNFQRGAAATIDREFLGWQGRFFLHDVAHYHVIHHFFPMMPWYHGEEATRHLRKTIGPHYHRSDAYVFQVLWYNYNFCQFVEDEGDVLFYRNRQGKSAWDIPALRAKLIHD
ncbi:fatty acid desaturase-domain-containing protein [Mycena alexandri]|uniref:Fatty acid desaturase-domain-containing protein n=1 Tax=Mycena alexandri TaxID=1745969 RepID=A0AAD6S3P3_9AGAR|nr:fatty acid desaturase-domain-containing protein [Mycena alexandri]